MPRPPEWDTDEAWTDWSYWRYKELCEQGMPEDQASVVAYKQMLAARDLNPGTSPFIMWFLVIGTAVVIFVASVLVHWAER